MRMQTARAFVRMKCVLSEVARIIVHSFMDFCAHSSQNGLANGRTSSYSYAIVMWDCGGRWDFRFAGRFWVNIFHFTNSCSSACGTPFALYIHCPVRVGRLAFIRLPSCVIYLYEMDSVLYGNCCCVCVVGIAAHVDCSRFIGFCRAVFSFTMMMAPLDSHPAQNAP